MNSVADNECKNGKCTLVMDLYPKNANDVANRNESVQGRCSLTAQQQTSIDAVTEEAVFAKLQFPIHPAKNVHSVAFQMYNQCSWPREGAMSTNILSFFHDVKAVQALELDFNSTSFPSLEQYSMKERITRLFDERNATYACNQGMSQEFAAKNMRNSSLHVQSLMIKGTDSEMHGFKVEHIGDFLLAPGQITRFQISYQPDFNVGISDGELQLLTSTGILSVKLKANIPKHIQSFCQNAALMQRVKKIILQVCSLALFVVLFVFGIMLKQEGVITSNESQLPTATNGESFPQRAFGRGTDYHNGKRSFIYVSFDIGCTYDKSKQCCRSLTKALAVVHAAINCIVCLKLLHIFHASHNQQAVMNITQSADSKSKSLTPINNESTIATSGMTGKRRATHLRAPSKPASTNFNEGTLALKSKASLGKKAINLLNVTMGSEKAGDLPCNAHSDKENEKTKQKKKKKGASCIETGSDNGKNSLSNTSSPIKQEELRMPVSPSSFSACTVVRRCESPTAVDSTDLAMVNNDGRRKVSDIHSSLHKNLGEGDSSLQKVQNNVSSDDLEAYNSYISSARSSLKHVERAAKCLQALPVVTPHERNLVKVATVRSSSKGLAATKSRRATLTTSATFPAPGRRHLPGCVPGVKEDRQNSVIWSSSSDLVSTSPMAPHARAPGSPLSPKSSPFHGNSLLCSPFITECSSHQFARGNILSNNRISRRGDFKGKSHYAHEMFHGCASEGSSPRKMHYPTNKQDSLGSDSISPYNIWGDHFADLGRRYGSYWIGKDIPIKRKASPLPPLLQTPPFSVFSSNDPFNQ